MVLFLLSQNWLPRPRPEDKDRLRTHNLKRAANSWRLWTPPEGFNQLDLQVQLLPGAGSSYSPNHLLPMVLIPSIPRPISFLHPQTSRRLRRTEERGIASCKSSVESRVFRYFPWRQGCTLRHWGHQKQVEMVILIHRITLAYETDIADLPTLWTCLSQSVLLHLCSPGKEKGTNKGRSKKADQAFSLVWVTMEKHGPCWEEGRRWLASEWIWNGYFKFDWSFEIVRNK